MKGATVEVIVMSPAMHRRDSTTIHSHAFFLLFRKEKISARVLSLPTGASSYYVAERAQNAPVSDSLPNIAHSGGYFNMPLARLRPYLPDSARGKYRSLVLTMQSVNISLIYNSPCIMLI
jgi:hypothetical protein